MIASRIASGLILLSPLAVACNKPGSDATPNSPGASSAVVASNAVETSSASTMKEYAAPRADRVGVLAPGTAVPVGQRVPDVHGRDLDGKDVQLSSLYAKGPVLLVFYRGGWCPDCNFEIHALVTAYPEYQKRGVTPVALSVDTPEAEAKLKATYTIPSTKVRGVGGRSTPLKFG